ncbi:ATP-binding protein [Pseudomonas sp. SH1-B]
MTGLLHWPRKLASRLFLIFLIGLVLAQGLSFCVQFYERYQSARTTMLGNLETDVSTAVAILDRLPAAERADWVPRLERGNYTYLLAEDDSGSALRASEIPMALRSIRDAIGHEYALTFWQLPERQDHFQVRLQLADGSPLAIDIRPSFKPLVTWLPLVLLGQLLLLIGCAWWAVRTAVAPLTRLAKAVETLDPNQHGVRLDEKGPSEVVHAASAFNTMQDRIAAYLRERMQLLAAISHDLQTPITRMKLRAELMDDSVEKDRLNLDLDEIEHLVREGVAYARSVHGAAEANCRIDLDAFLDSLALDYQDTGQSVQLLGRTDARLDTRPHALRRVLVNLLDNAVKFSGAAQIESLVCADGALSIRVLDRGPGIPEERLVDVFQPFYRLEASRNRSTGGTGLGLAIALQLAQALGGSLRLSNRDGGGLCAELCLPQAAVRS